MSGIDAITAAASASASASQMPALGVEAGPIQVAGPQPSASFGQFVGDGVEQVNQALIASQSDLQSLALGNAQNLHQIMMRLEENPPVVRADDAGTFSRAGGVPGCDEDADLAKGLMRGCKAETGTG